MPAFPGATVRPPQRPWVAQAIGYLLIALLLGCVYWLVRIERTKGPALRAEAAGQQRRVTGFPARRGSIVDSNPGDPQQHTTLATSHLLDCVGIDPQVIDPEHRSVVAHELGRLLGLGATAEAELVARMIAAVPPADLPPGEPSRSLVRYIPVKRLISDQQSEAIRALRSADSRFRCVVLNPELTRSYPAGQLGSHVLGFVGNFGQALEGIEKRYDEYLTGHDGSKKAVADRSRRPIWSSDGDYVPPRDGLTVVLNINAVIQAHTEKAIAETVKKFQAESGIAVVMDPRTGAVLAMANYPTFDPNQGSDAAVDSRRNRALTDPFEPGSIFKWGPAAVALDAAVVTQNTQFDCHLGSWNLNGRTIRDVHGYGLIDVRTILTKSSNIGMAQIAMRLGPERLHAGLTRFGFGHKTGVELGDAESAGLLYPLSRWTSYSLPSVSFGQEVTVSSLQMVTAFSAIANGAYDPNDLFVMAELSEETRRDSLGRDGKLKSGGYLLRPRLVRAIIDDSQTPLGGEARVVEDLSRPVVRRRVVSAATARTMIDILTEAVEKGTGQNAKIEGVKVFGKTGTAQIGQNGRYLPGKFTASFICGAPAEAPRLVVLVSVRAPKQSLGYYGGTVAAPAAREIVEKSLAFLTAK